MQRVLFLYPKFKKRRKTIMYIFEAKYTNMDTNEERTQSIEFDGDNFFDTEKNAISMQ